MKVSSMLLELLEQKKIKNLCHSLDSIQKILNN